MSSNHNRETGILFRAPMVKAILEGRKTQSRRIVKAKNSDPSRCINMSTLMANVNEWRYQNGRWFGIDGYDTLVYANCPYGSVGDRLWVRETWCHKVDDDGRIMYNAEGNYDTSCFWYRADGVDPICTDGDGGTAWNKDGSMKSPWVPSIHMPRWASRITLEITGVRVERLKEISEEDAKAEGVKFGTFEPNECRTCARGAFMDLWESINGKDSWLLNPWVWVIEFKRDA